MPLPMAEQMVLVRCRTCGRLLGQGPADFRIYCPEPEQGCVGDYAIATAEARDALIEAIFQKTGRAKTAIAKDFGVSRQRVDQILASRSYRRG